LGKEGGTLKHRLRIALVGDHRDAVLAHRAIERSLELASGSIRPVEWEWTPTRSITPVSAGGLARFHGVWCVPGSPYESEAGAVAAIRTARTSGIPFLGTCAGCQHAILEYARNVLGLTQAEHAESVPEAGMPLISQLSCALVETSAPIFLGEGTRIRAIYGQDRIEEGYHCSFGLNRTLEHLFEGTSLQVSGRGPEGEARALELNGHPFFLLTQFQPERRALSGSLPPLVAAFVEAAGLDR